MSSNFKSKNKVIFFTTFFSILILGFFFQPQKLFSQEIKSKDIKNPETVTSKDTRNPIDKIVFRQSSFHSQEPIGGIIYLSNKTKVPLYKGILEIRVDKLEKDVFPPNSLNAIKVFYIKDIDLLPEASTVVPFSFDLPKEAGAGPYMVWVDYYTLTSNHQGQASQVFELLDGEQIIQYPISTRVYDDPEREYRTPVVKPNSNLTAEIKIKNIISKPLSLKAKIKVYQFFDLDKIENSSFVYEKDFNVESSQEKQIKVNFPAPPQPGSYHVDIFILHDGKEIATNRESIHVEGVSGEISNLSLSKPFYEKGEKVEICYEIDGPLSPNNLKLEKEHYPKSVLKAPQNTVPTPLPLIFNLEILQNNQKIKFFEKKIEIKDIWSPTTTVDCFNFVTEIPLYNFSLFASLKDESKKELDTIYLETAPKIQTEKPIPQKQEQKPIPQKNKMKTAIEIIVGAIILLGFIVGLILTLKRKKKTLSIFFFLFISSFLFYPVSHALLRSCQCVNSTSYACECRNGGNLSCPSYSCQDDYNLIYYLCESSSCTNNCTSSRTCDGCCVQYTQDCSANYCDGWQLVTGYCTIGGCKKTKEQCNDNCCKQYCGGDGYCNASGDCKCRCTPSCGAWSQCVNGVQTRTCTRQDCTTYTETQSCSVCGNGSCEAGENCSNCPSDCGCPSGQVCQNGTCVTQAQAQCGNGVCESGENCSNCPSDCGCPLGQVCQNGVCVTQCSCTSWVNQGCGGGGCASNQMYQTRICTPSGCATEAQCVYDSSCVNNSPSATNLEVTSPDYCKFGPGANIFSWKFTDPDGDSQSAYQVQVDNNSNFSSPEVDSGKINSSSNSYSPQSGLSFNTTYYWRVRVWDSKGNASSWSNGPSFTTPKHPWPTPAFTFSPEKPQLDQVVQFTDKSQAFGEATIKSWFWTFQDGNPSQSTQKNPTTTFSSYGQKQVTLSVVDSDNLGPCSTSTILNLRKPLLWWELPFNPSLWFRKIFASVRELFY